MVLHVRLLILKSALTEHTDTSLPGNLTICPRVVSLKSPGNTVRVPVRVCNLSARAIEIPLKPLLCSLNSVSVVDSWTPASSQKSDESEKVSESGFEDLGVSVETDNLSAEQLNKVRQVLTNWSHIFSKDPTDLGKADIVKHKIKLTNNTPFKDPYRRIPPAMYEEVRQHLKEMLDADAIRPSESVGSLGFFECNRMAFGLTNAPSTFQRLMERCMGELNLRECLIFLDDILFFSVTFEEHMRRLEAVFSRLHEHGLKLKPSKYEFFKSSIWDMLCQNMALKLTLLKLRL